MRPIIVNVPPPQKTHEEIEQEAEAKERDERSDRGGSVCLNRFSGLISGVPAVVMKMMDPRSGTA